MNWIIEMFCGSRLGPAVWQRRARGPDIRAAVVFGDWSPRNRCRAAGCNRNRTPGLFGRFRKPPRSISPAAVSKNVGALDPLFL